MKRRALFLLLSLALLFSLVLPAATAYADDNSSGKGMEISKTAAYNEDGSYTITLEAYATGAKVISDISKDIPTDIILVLDQSGSMADDIGQVRYTEYTGNNTQNKSNYEKRHNGGSANLWHKLPDGSYVSVSVTLHQTITHDKITKGRNDNSDSGYTNYWENRNNLYTYVNGEIKKVVYTRERDWIGENWNCTYALEDGTILNQNNKGSRHSPTFQNTDDGYLYLAVVNENQNVYTYTYTDTNGTTQTIGTSTGASTRFTPAFYQRSTTTSGGGSRLNALKNAANVFASAVATKAAGEDGTIGTDDDIDHRIAVVGFADTDSDYGYNTGVFIGSTLNRYQTAAAAVYGKALQDMSTTAGKNNVTASIDALQASGATRIDYGLTMANGILNANTVPTGEKRNRVVIVFTDGSPTNSNGFELSVANSAINTANSIKEAGVTVYSIGIFSGADASSAGKEPDEDYYDGYFGSNYTAAKMSAACNWFMQKVSSNNGTPRTPSYYLSAGDSASLNSIFQQISDQIETGGSSSTLTDQSVVKDIITPYFELTEGTTAKDIKIETFACTGKDAGGEYTWSNNNSTMGATASINGDRVDVTGFNFSENYVGTVTENGNITYRGHKLVISFKVFPKAGFLGGNDVDTNTNAGIYENKDATSPVLTFEKPKVNVPIKGITVTAQDKNIYLLGDVTADQLKGDATVTVGNVSLDLSKPNFGLEAWQNEFVDIRVDIVDADDVSVSGLTDLKDDTTYKIKVTVSPKTPNPNSTIGPKAEDKSSQGNANIYVFKPEVTFKDSVEDYGTDVGKTYYEATNKAGTVWKHGTTDAANADMIGTEPALDYTYDPASAKLATDDLPVKVALVKIGNADVTGHVTFKREDCTHSGCEWNDLYAEGKEKAGQAHFIVHVNKIEITITKIVEGNFGDKLKNFSFAYKIGDVDGGTFTLRNEQSTNPAITVPVGAKFTLTEATDGKYSTVFKYGDTQLSSRTVNNGAGVQVSFTVEEGKDKVTVTNTRDTTPDMGVSLDSLPYIIVLAAVAVTAVVIILRKRRNNDD